MFIYTMSPNSFSSGSGCQQWLRYEKINWKTHILPFIDQGYRCIFKCVVCVKDHIPEIVTKMM